MVLAHKVLHIMAEMGVVFGCYSGDFQQNYKNFLAIRSKNGREWVTLASFRLPGVSYRSALAPIDGPVRLMDMGDVLARASAFKGGAMRGLLPLFDEEN